MILKNCRFILTQNSSRDILEGADIKIEENKIVKIGKNLRAERGEEKLDCSRVLVMPGLINCHCHVAMTQMRGVADDVNLQEFLNKTFELDAKMKREHVHAGAIIGIIEMIKSGTTAFQDLYYFEDAVAEAARKIGMRGVLAWAVLDKEFTTQQGVPLENAKKFAKSIKNDPLLRPALGLQGVYVCSERTYMDAKEFCEHEGLTMHTHLSENGVEVSEHVKKTGMRPAEWLEKIGFLSWRLSAAHCVHLADAEISMVARRGVSVVHCPSSNLKLSSGIMNWNGLKAAGVNISLGTDGCASNNNLDMFEEMHIAALLHKLQGPSVARAQEVLDAATINGARAIGINAGSIEVGKLADLITIDLNDTRWTPLIKSMLISHIVYSINSSSVRDSIINGKLVMQNRKIDGEEKMLRAAEQLMLRR